MDNEIKDIIEKNKNNKNIIVYRTPYGICHLKYIDNKLKIINFIENPIWKNQGCQEA